MRAMDELDRKLCSVQAALFERSLAASPGSSASFVRRFMRSPLAQRIDSGSFPFESDELHVLIEEVDSHYTAAPYGSEKYTANEMHWMGYLYRCLCQITGKPSKEVYRLIGARELRTLYYPYHSLDPEQAAERILEAKGLLGVSHIERGVRILKAIRGIA